MRAMKRPLTLAAALAAALTLFALPAAAGNDHNVNGTVTSVTPKTISVQARNGVVTTCSLGLHSPAVAGFAPGDHVRIVCHGAGKHMARLAKIRRLDPTTAPAPASADTEPVTFGGAITALSDTSISLHDGDRDLTCTIGDGSPSTGDYKVGQHVKVACAGGSLVSISPVGSGDAGRYFTGTVVSLDDKGITVNTEHGSVTCSIGDGSPSTAGVNVGDHVGIGCRASTMQLVLVRELGGSDGSTSGSDGSTSSGDGSTGDNSGSGSSAGGDTTTTPEPTGGGN